uniref:RWP-RK domain-containing protein n=1 Tax=Guillardia theta TaxID=55529 RepID=A0A7S4L1K4_GUITH|mmetsp:Transcript_35683/g.111647  ORF Transcript_35683/g.111647 Transcript_35683/m.111647 type:complete len:526 (+) Transcript_35683:287-1864(+)
METIFPQSVNFGWENSAYSAERPFQPAAIETMENYNGAIDFETGVSTLVVGLTAPHKIFRVSQEWLDLFKLSREEVAGRSLKLIQGPATDVRKVSMLIQAALMGKESKAAITMYTSSGNYLVLTVNSKPILENNEPVACSLTMKPADVVYSKAAMADDGMAKVVLGISQPFHVEYVSSAFTYLYGISDHQIRGRTLRMIQGPRTDLSVWASLFNEAQYGTSQFGSMFTSTIDCTEVFCDVQVYPVVNGMGVITHMMAIFNPAYDKCEWSQPQEVPAEMPYMRNTGDLVHMNTAMPPAPQEMFESKPQMFSFAPNVVPYTDNLLPSNSMMMGMENLVPDMHGMSLNFNSMESASNGAVSTVIPRRKAGQQMKDSTGPVCITLEILDMYSDTSLTEAAKRLGISSTAMKKACRKLGVSRWPYKKNPEVGMPGHYDDAYVRKIHRKYAAKKAKDDASKTSSPHSPGSPEPVTCASRPADAEANVMGDVKLDVSNDWMRRGQDFFFEDAARKEQRFDDGWMQVENPFWL